jgi:hypothetical protein
MLPHSCQCGKWVFDSGLDVYPVVALAKLAGATSARSCCMAFSWKKESWKL